MSRSKGVETVGVTVRMPVDVVEKLDILCKVSGIKRSQYIINMIVTDYDTFNGNPELKELLATMKSLSEKFNSFSKQ